MAAVTVIGAGLAGCEAAWQLAEAGVDVCLVEMKPGRRSPAHSDDGFAELVCSNSLRGAALSNAVGLLKGELRRAGSLILREADANAVPAGGALAVDRQRFSQAVTEAIRRHPRITVEEREVEALPEEGPLVVATGPLTTDALAADIARRTGADALAFHDAIAPIIDGESIDRDKVFAASRYDKGDPEDYLNCPFDEDGYHAFIQALNEAERAALRDFEEPHFFPGCMPIEAIAEQGTLAPAHGPMKPVGLRDPRTERRPYAVVQLRKEDVPGTAYNLVGFQTRLKQPAQREVFRRIPGLEKARFLRYGAVHRNTFLDGPKLLDAGLRLRSEPRIRFAGQITGVEGYVESVAAGLVAAFSLCDELQGRPESPPPPETALGALLGHVVRGEGGRYEPSNIRWDFFPPLATKIRRRRERREAMAQRALETLEGWLRSDRVLQKVSL